jgi:hypothetical protein
MSARPGNPIRISIWQSSVHCTHAVNSMIYELRIAIKSQNQKQNYEFQSQRVSF